MLVDDPTSYEHIEVLPIKPSGHADDANEPAPLIAAFHLPDVHALKQLATLDAHCGDASTVADWPAAVAVGGDLLLREAASHPTFDNSTVLRLVLISPLVDAVDIRDGADDSDEEPEFLTSIRNGFQARRLSGTHIVTTCTILHASQEYGVHVDVLVPGLPEATQAQLAARDANVQDIDVLVKGLQHGVTVLPTFLDLLAHVKVVY